MVHQHGGCYGTIKMMIMKRSNPGDIYGKMQKASTTLATIDVDLRTTLNESKGKMMVEVG